MIFDEETTEADLRILRQDLAKINQREMRIEGDYSLILEAQKRTNIKIDIILLLQLFTTIMLSLTL